MSLSFAEQLRLRREQQQHSLQALADRANVSKSMISKIERGEVQPSLDIAARLAEALGTNLSEMLRLDKRARVIWIPYSEQATARDPDGHHERRIISPVFARSSIEWLRITLHPGTSSGRFPAHHYGAEEYLVLLSGALRAVINEDSYELHVGDSLYFEAHHPHEFINAGQEVAEYLVVVKR
jgi:transcriptional regulator with XRE-family HTH domain